MTFSGAYHEGDRLPEGATSLDIWRCVSCQTDFVFHPAPPPEMCPVCGQGSWCRKHVAIEGLPADVEFKTELRSPSGFLKEERVMRFKQAGNSRQRARESLSFVHTDPEKTKKEHSVYEWTGTEWVSVHSETQEFPAKHRDEPPVKDDPGK
jgi:hypothetical protein